MICARSGFLFGSLFHECTYSGLTVPPSDDELRTAIDVVYILAKYHAIGGLFFPLYGVNGNPAADLMQERAMKSSGNYHSMCEALVHQQAI